MSLGKAIARLRIKKGWTQRELAEHAEMHQNHINRLENDRMRPRPRTLEKLAEVLDSSAEELVAAESQNPPDWAGDDPELAELLTQIPMLDEEQRQALRTFLRSMVTCQEVRRVTSRGALRAG